MKRKIFKKLFLGITISCMAFAGTNYVQAEEDSSVLTIDVENENLVLYEDEEGIATELEYGFIDYEEFSEYWFDGIFRCGIDFEMGDYYILPLFGTGAIYDVQDTPNDFTWSSHRLLRKITVQEGEYVNVAHGGIMVHADEVDINNWPKYGVYLVGKDILAGEYKMETLSDRYASELYAISGISGAYQLNLETVEADPIDCNCLFDSSAYISLEDGQYITITNMKLTNIDALQKSYQTTVNDTPIEEMSDEIIIDEAQWNEWTADGHCSMFTIFMETADLAGYSLDLPSGQEDNHKIGKFLFVDDGVSTELSNAEIYYGIEKQTVEYMGLCTEDRFVFESDAFKEACIRLMLSYNIRYDSENEKHVLNLTHERAEEIVEYILDNEIEDCLVENMRIRFIQHEDNAHYRFHMEY